MFRLLRPAPEAYSERMSAKRDQGSKSSAGRIDLSAFRQPANTGPSLDQLGASLAGMMTEGDDPYAVAPEHSTSAAAELEPVPAAVDDTVCPISPRSILEAMLFVGMPTNEPLSSGRVAGLMRGVRTSEIDALVRELNADYERRGCPYTITAEAAGYRLRLTERYSALRDRFYGKARAARLSQAAIDILSIVAYHAPIAADEISQLRGKPSGPILLQLVRRQLLALERVTGRPRRVQYTTTPRFLELFGLSSLEELPRSQELEQT